MTDKKYTIRPKGKTEPVFEVVGNFTESEKWLIARLSQGVSGNSFSMREWDIEESKPTTLDLLNDCGENAYVASLTSGDSFGYVKEGGKWFHAGSYNAAVDVSRVARYIDVDRGGLEIIFEGVK